MAAALNEMLGREGERVGMARTHEERRLTMWRVMAKRAAALAR